MPAKGLTLNLPSPPGRVGPFIASGNAVTLTIDPDVSLAIIVSGSTLNLTCRPYANNLASSGIVSSAPAGSPISPVIATSATTATVPPTTPPTAPATPTTTPGPTPTTTQASTDSSAIAQAFDTLFNPSSSIAAKEAVIQNGASIETGLNNAFSSSLSSSATGATVDDISFPDNSGCTQAGLTSPCAQVTYDILAANGSALLPNNQGYAVSVAGTWLIATNTVCTLLGLFYTAEGNTGSPPGCPATVSSTTPTTVPDGSAPTSTTPASAPDATATTTPRGSSSTASPAITTRTGASATNGSTGTSDPPSKPDPVVQASSGSLAFTGLGIVAQWLAIVGGALMIFGFALLAIVDTPRRVMYRLATLNPVGRRTAPRSDRAGGADHGGDPNKASARETLWISRR